MDPFALPETRNRADSEIVDLLRRPSSPCKAAEKAAVEAVNEGHARRVAAARGDAVLRGRGRCGADSVVSADRSWPGISTSGLPCAAGWTIILSAVMPAPLSPGRRRRAGSGTRGTAGTVTFLGQRETRLQGIVQLFAQKGAGLRRDAALRRGQEAAAAQRQRIAAAQGAPKLRLLSLMRMLLLHR